MKKYLTAGLIALVFLVGLVLAGKPASTPAAVNIPAHAVEVAPGLFYLGVAVDNGRLVEGYAMFVKPPCNNDGVCDLGEKKSCADCRNGGGEEPDASSCYDLLSRGTKWKTVEPYLVNATNTRGLDPVFVASNLAADIIKWEIAAGEIDILGNEIAGIVDGVDLESPDNKNEVMFADIDYEGAIAVAIIWGYFGGPPPFRELVEWDMVFDDVDFDWSATGEAGKMDFENIATHELGHSVGLGDLYNAKCSEETMYGYANYGETKKRTLEAGDITGVQKLYT